MINDRTRNQVTCGHTINDNKNRPRPTLSDNKVKPLLPLKDQAVVRRHLHLFVDG
jgi:hypothetical protein